jgi:hypothetical protein
VRRSPTSSGSTSGPNSTAGSGRASSRDGHPYFELRRSPIQGRGAFALVRIPKGTRIIEYTGELISRDEGDRRYDDENMSRHHTFLFALDDDTVVDGAVHGNASRFINHSCEPNCEAVIEDGRIWVEALTTIQPGTELVYDYAYERRPEHDESTEQMYACRCGAPTCRGTILAPKPRKAAKARRSGKASTSRSKSPSRGAAKSRSTSRSPSASKTSPARKTRTASGARPGTPTTGRSGTKTKRPARRG